MLVLSMISFSSAIQSNWTDGYGGTNYGSWGYSGGMQIHPEQPIILKNVTVGSFTSFSTLLIKAGNWDSASPLAVSTNKSGDVFYFNDVLLDADDYWIIGSTDGNHEYGGLGNPTVPKTDNGITWIDGLNPTNSQLGQASLTGGFDIYKVDYELPSLLVINLTAELSNPINNASVTVPVNLSAILFVSNSNLTNATLYIWNASNNNLILTDYKNETLENSSKVESWIETLPVNNSYIWNVQVCEIGGLCVFDEENETFNVIPTPVPTPTPNPYHLIKGSGSIFDTLNSAGAGLGSFISVMGVALPTLLIGLGFVGVLVAIGFGIAYLIRNSINNVGKA